MVIGRGDMKRKRRDECPSPVLDESPKRTKVHAQRKFAQGSNVNSPVITPVKELEKEDIDVLPEPVELLPIKRPNTEDFLTFLCFRGTPILPPNLNFFNTASIVDTNGQVHEIKSESPKNGPIDTSTISKTGQGTSERPFIAFGVRKRADPIVISRQMDKKRRHALALQTLRRKYQEQRMAKIRAVTISKLSEKTSSKTLVRSNSISKTETITKKTSSLPKTKDVSAKVTTRSMKPTLRPQIKQKMCLRSFSGRFVQKELQFRNVKKRPLPVKKVEQNIIQKIEPKKSESSEYSSDDEEPLVKTSKNCKNSSKVVLPKIAKKSAPAPKKPIEMNFRITRSNKFLNNKMVSRRLQIKQRMILSTPQTIVKPRTLRSHSKSAKLIPTTRNMIVPIKIKKELNKEPTKKDRNCLVKKVVKPIEFAKKESKENTKADVGKLADQSKKSTKPVDKKDVKSSEINKKNVTKSTATAKKDGIIAKKDNTPVSVTNKNKVEKIIKKEPVDNKKTKVQLIKKVEPLPKKKSIIEVRKAIPTNKKPIEVEKKDETPETKSQRPSRKTKEAAAIYMEILSHKLVNESRIDDDNVSIDSFPELPNVKKTEQRENELKAKARSCKTSESETDNKKIAPKAKEKEEGDDVEVKNLRSNDKKKMNTQPLAKIDSVNVKNEDKHMENVKKKVSETQVKEEIKKPSVKVENVKEEVTQVCDRKTRSSNIEKTTQTPEKTKEKEVDLKNNLVEVKSEKFIPKIEKQEVAVMKEAPIAEDCPKPDSPIIKKQVIKKAENSKIEDMEMRRQTRNSTQTIKHAESDDSDESFHADIVIPKKKQLTRSKFPKNVDDLQDSLKSSNITVKKLIRPPSRSYKESSSSESDQSTTSDINIKTNKITKNKKFTKTRSQQQTEPSFSDSDEEPLSKLTQNKIASVKSVCVIKKETHSKSIKDNQDMTEESNEGKDDFKKPKRECAKRPQNYLPMLSSSDEDEEYFQAFQSKNEPYKQTKAEVNCLHASASLDLSCKDIGRRFGKGKVNMSTEQIEKWLKDAAMAGNSVKNENDAMLKFGEKIPTETSHSIAFSIDTEKLKTLLISAVEKVELDKKHISIKSQTKECSTLSPAITSKPCIIDRKLIFRNKDKLIKTPNSNAFSASNESSVYAFGEETEDMMKTPFRRPTRRPSSTATSRSEDESSKFEDLATKNLGQFRKPPLVRQDSTKSTQETSEENTPTETEDNSFYTPVQPASYKNKSSRGDKKAGSMVPPTMTAQKGATLKILASKQSIRGFDKNSEASDDLKYKIPSSPSASSSSSAKLYKRQTKFRSAEILPVKLPEFPVGNVCAQLVEAPTFHPTEKEFQDPLEYIEKIRPKAEQFGICRIVPPSNFKPECKVTDDMRFTAYNQFVHKMLHRWGPNFKELMAIKKYLSTQNISLTHSPWIGGMEIDLPRLYQTVQSLGGLKEVIEKKKWPKVSEAMKIPKSAQDRVTKLDDIYCKYLLPYDTLSPAEREKLFDEVETEWAKRESKSFLKAQQNIEDNTNEEESDSDDEAEECIVKGRSMALNAFYRIARNTMSMWFKTQEPPAEEVEQEFWKHVTHKQNHICVHSGSIDSGNWGYGFAVSKNSPFARHAWNLKVLTNNSGSVLRSMGPVMGVTVPTLHVGMVFSSCCWYRDPHSLPWIEYLHTGGNKIWYGIPDSTSAAFHSALKNLVPNYCRNKSLWLPSDTVMVPPNLLVDNGVSLCRIVQEPGQFIVVFPKVFTSCLSTGYVVSESVYFAPPYWLKTGRGMFDELRNSCEQSMFSFDRLLLSIVNDPRTNVEVLKQIIPAVQELADNEKAARDRVKNMGVTATEKLPLPDDSKVRKKRKLQNEDGEYECDICRMNLYISMVTESQDDGVFCLEHAAEQIEKKKIQNKHCKLTFTYDYQELEELDEKIQAAITNKLQKKIPNKYTGMPTLLTK